MSLVDRTSHNYLGSAPDLGFIPVDPSTLKTIATKIIPDAATAVESIFAPKTVRNRNRRHWRDKAMNWLYNQGVHHINDTGRDGRYNDSIKQLVGLVKSGGSNAVSVINQVIGQKITPAIVTQTINKYNQQAQQQAQEKANVNKALMNIASGNTGSGNSNILPLFFGLTGLGLAGGITYVIVHNKGSKK